jgi:hypothetical protein
MGGMGSGRRYQGGRSTTEDYRSLDVRKLHKAGLLAAGHGQWSWYSRASCEPRFQVQEAGRLILSYTRPGRRAEGFRYPVRLDWTPCQHGGRVLGSCARRLLRRRVAILYGGAVFACRHCYRLAYESQRGRDYDRLAGRADKIRRRLGWPVGILNPTP